MGGIVSLDTSLAVDTSDPPPHRGVLHPYDDHYYRWKESTKGATTLLRHTYLYTRRYNYDELHMQRPLQQEFDSNRKNVRDSDSGSSIEGHCDLLAKL